MCVLYSHKPMHVLFIRIFSVAALLSSLCKYETLAAFLNKSVREMRKSRSFIDKILLPLIIATLIRQCAFLLKLGQLTLTV